MSVEHYENFPVASLLMPAHLRPAVKAIYAFARSADDIADEGDASSAQRLAQLENYRKELQCLQTGQVASTPMFTRLAQAMQQHNLPWLALEDLLLAFTQDVHVQRYPSYATLLDYCRLSANPVGCLMLHLYQAATAENLRDSDAICSALQIINFLQDVAIDLQKQRIYLPQEDLQRFAVTEAAIAAHQSDAAWCALMEFEVARARALMLSGAALALRLRGRLGWELRLVVQGGLLILEKIEAVNYDVFRQRPILSKFDWVKLAWRALRMRA